MQFIPNDGGRKSAGFTGITGDCVARSIAIATGKPYNEIYERLAQGNEDQRQTKHGSRRFSNGKHTAAHGINTGRKWFKDYMTELGFSWTPTMQIGQGCKTHLKAEELPSGRLVVAVSKHYTAVIEGVINDIYNPDRGENRCVYGYWKLKTL
jgi:hypothetical protein